MTEQKSFKSFKFLGMALDPIHAGTGGTRLGRVDSTIVRDPVTRIPKIPGSSLAGVMRAYTAMKYDKYPDCAGQDGHCGKIDCQVCTVFGFPKSDTHGGFAGLAGFSDIHVMLFPVASQAGPQWITSPMSLQLLNDKSGKHVDYSIADDTVYRKKKMERLNLGWLSLPVRDDGRWADWTGEFSKFAIPEYITKNLGVVSDKLFTHIVNSNLEVRTSVAIDPETGAAKDKALFSYEALPRSTVVFWELTCRNPKHFKIGGKVVESANSPGEVKEIVAAAYSYLEYLGIGGMGSRGMGRLRVLPEINSAGRTGTGGGE